MNKQKGFSLVEGLLVVLVVSVIGFAGYTVWNNGQDDETEQTETAKQEQPAQNSIEEAQESDEVAKVFVVPENWITVSENGVAVSYPKEWDKTEEDYQKLSVIGKNDGSVAYVGFGTPYGYTYSNGEWTYVDSDGNELEDYRENIGADVNVNGADSTIVVGSGDGGCGGSRIIFAANDSLYVVALPWDCDVEAHGSAGIDSELVAKDLDKVISSIVIN